MDTKLLFCTVTVGFGEGQTVARYRWSDLDTDGSEGFDEDLSEWTEDEIREHVASMVGIADADADRINIVWD